MGMKPLGALLLAGALVAGCRSGGDTVATADLIKPDCTGNQGWSPEDQCRWYGGTQGSRFMPWSWAQALERPGEPGKFFDAQWLTRFRLLPRGAGELPVGVVIDQQDDRQLTVTKLRWVAGQANNEKWVGFNCAACHTAEITRGGERLRIDGGPGLTDFQALVDAADVALAQTRADPAKWDRFATAVLGTAATDAVARDKLGGEVDKLRAWNRRIALANLPTLAPGFARVDAFGHIYNKVALLAGPDAPVPLPSSAPVSYPFLWNTHQADRVQWNGIAENTKIGKFEYGALGRNSGEVIGVYGDVAMIKNPGKFTGYRSSLQITNLNDLERLLPALRPPVWPVKWYGKPDQALVAQGAGLFGQHCASCHTPLRATAAGPDLATPFVSQMNLFRDAVPPGTDPWMACNAFTYEARTGNLAGLPSGYLSLSGDKATLGPQEPVANMLRTAVVGALIQQKGELVKAAGASWLGVPPRPQVIDGVRGIGESDAARLQRCMAATDKEDPKRIAGYRARPLTGIWATAPYLHNGSVPNLHELLLPPARRSAEFHLGSREFDAARVGYVTARSADNSFRFVARDAQGPVPGNSNAGHDYGNASFDAGTKRAALIEYMKTL